MADNSTNMPTRQLFSICMSSLNSMMFGLSLTSYNIVETASKSYSTQNRYITFDTLSSLAVSGVYLGGVIFNLVNQIKNMKKMIVFSTLMTLIGYGMILSYPNIYNIIVARTLIGIGCGCSCYVVPQYITKLVKDENGGLYASLHPINISIGILLGQALQPFGTTQQWYYVYGTIVAANLLIQILDFMILEDTITETDDKNMRSLFTTRDAYKSIAFTIFIHISQHMSGVDYITIYLTRILKNDYLSILGTYFLSVPSIILSSVLLNAYGRRHLYLTSLAMTFVSLIILLKYKVLGVIVFIIGYNIGIATIPWIIPNEASPPAYVPQLTKLGIIANWISAYVLVILFSKLHAFSDVLGFLTYASLMGIMYVICLFYMPESKGNNEFF